MKHQFGILKKKTVYFLSLFLVLTATACGAAGERDAKTETADNTLQLIRNATVKLDYAGKTILVDPMLSGKGELISIIGVNKNPTVHLTMPVEEVVADVDFVLATHSHFDHFDQAAATAMADTLKLYIQPADSAVYYKDFGLKNTEVVDETTTIDNVTIRRTSGQHGNGTLKEMMGEVSGFILQADGCPTVYIVGDCIWTNEIKANIEKFQPDWVVINAGGAIHPVLSPEFGPILMNEKDVVTMIKDSPAKCRFIAVHLEAVDHAQTTRSILRNEADHAGIPKDKLIIPADGEVIDLK